MYTARAIYILHLYLHLHLHLHLHFVLAVRATPQTVRLHTVPMTTKPDHTSGAGKSQHKRAKTRLRVKIPALTVTKTATLTVPIGNFHSLWTDIILEYAPDEFTAELLMETFFMIKGPVRTVEYPSTIEPDTSRPDHVKPLDASKMHTLLRCIDPTFELLSSGSFPDNSFLRITSKPGSNQCIVSVAELISTDYNIEITGGAEKHLSSTNRRRICDAMRADLEWEEH